MKEGFSQQYNAQWVAARKALCQGVSEMTHAGHICKITKQGKVIGEKGLQVCNEPYSDNELKILAWLFRHFQRGFGEASAVDGRWHAQYCTVKSMAKLYAERAAELALEDAADYDTFKNTVKKLNRVPYVPPGCEDRLLITWNRFSAFGKCTYCLTLIMSIKQTLRPELRAAWLAVLAMHREVAYREKQEFYRTREEALEDQRLICAGQDNLDKVKTRMINLGAFLKGYGADDLMFVNATLGVVTVAGNGHYFYLADPKLPDDGNLAIEMLHLTWQHIGERRAETAAKTGEPAVEMQRMDTQVDGCRVNKNKIKWAWMAWLVATKQQLQAADNYMLVGHTHDLTDAILAIVSRWIKQGLVINPLIDLAKAIIDAFNQRTSKPFVRVVVLQSVHHWKKFFGSFVPPIEKVAATVPDIERPHRFELWYDEQTDEVQLWYMNLRQQKKYWNSEGIDMLPNGYPKDLTELEVATPANDLIVARHLKKLAKLRMKFMKVFELQVPGVAHLLTVDIKRHWEQWWDTFSEVTKAQVTDPETGETKTATVSRAKEDLSDVVQHMQDGVHLVRMLPTVTAARAVVKPCVKLHVVPPVAPIKISAKGWAKVNTDVDQKFLRAFLDGATDTECVRAARKVIQQATQPISGKPISQKRVGTKVKAGKVKGSTSLQHNLNKVAQKDLKQVTLHHWYCPHH